MFFFKEIGAFLNTGFVRLARPHKSRCPSMALLATTVPCYYNVGLAHHYVLWNFKLSMKYSLCIAHNLVSMMLNI